MIYAAAPKLEEFNLLSTDDNGVGDESIGIIKNIKKSINYYLNPITRQSENSELKFLSLKIKWKSETVMLSSVNDIVLHPAYQQIIGMGKEAIPLILSEMKETPGHWFWALKCITGEDPVLPEQRGKIKEMADTWIAWGIERGYL